MFIPDQDLDFLPIPDPGVKKAPDPGFATLDRGTERQGGRREEKMSSDRNLSGERKPKGANDEVRRISSLRSMCTAVLTG
jgi:hypothetical protein